jgi:HK97 family phage prohead protease
VRSRDNGREEEVTELKTKNFASWKAEVKAVDGERGMIEGYAAVFGNVDRHGDILMPGSLKHKRVKVPLFWNHNPDMVVGWVVVTEDEKGYKYTGKLAVDSENEQTRKDAEWVYSHIKEGRVTQNSFGFVIEKGRWEKKKIDGEEKHVFLIEKADVAEVSVVPMAANPKAGVTMLKSARVEELEECIRRLEAELKAASGSTDLPLADRDREWDADAAVRRVREWAGGPDKESVQWSKYRRAFFWYDESDPENFGSYKLPFADVIDGRLMAVPRGIFAAAAAVQGARGGVNIPDGDRDAVRRKIAAYYRRMDETPPWEEEKEVKPQRIQDISDAIMWGFF